MIANHLLIGSTPIQCSTGSGLEWSGNCLENSATAMNREGSIPSLPATLSRSGAPGRAVALQKQRRGFESFPECHRGRGGRQATALLTRQVFNRTTGFDSQALGHFMGVRRIRLAAPVCKTEFSIGESRFKSGGTHQFCQSDGNRHTSAPQKRGIGSSKLPSGTILRG